MTPPIGPHEACVLVSGWFGILPECEQYEYEWELESIA
jgi:hypothetical protein